jgi:hypothetical protein
MGLIENENLESIPCRSKDCSLAKISGVINTVVTGSINLYNIQ